LGEEERPTGRRKKKDTSCEQPEKGGARTRNFVPRSARTSKKRLQQGAKRMDPAPRTVRRAIGWRMAEKEEKSLGIRG